MYNCEEIREKIEQYIDGNLSEKELELIEEHFKNCSSCREELCFARKIRNVLAGTELPDAPVDFVEQINKRIDYIEEKERKKSQLKHLFNYRTYSVVAACFLLAVFIGINSDREISDNIVNDTTYKIGVHDVQIPVPVSEETHKPDENFESGVVIDVPVEDREDTSEKKREIKKATKKETAPKRNAAPEQTDIAIEKDSEASEVFDSSQVTEENEELFISGQSEIAPETEATPDNENNAEFKMRSSGGGSGVATASFIAEEDEQVGSVSVQAEHMENTVEFALKYGVCVDGVYEMTQKEYSEFAAALKNAQIEFSASVGADDIVRFEIIAG